MKHRLGFLFDVESGAASLIFVLDQQDGEPPSDR